MKFLSPRNRIALGLTGAVLAVICISKITELIPDRDKMHVRSRVDLTESIALGGSATVMNGGLSPLESYLSGIVERNDELVSSGVRDSSRQLVLEIGDHKKNWQLKESDKSSHSQMQIPIFSSADEKWGTIELRFKPLHEAGFWGLLQTMDFGLMLFIGSTCFVIFSFILQLILKQLDPKKAVPQQVRDALDSLAEGLMILDTNQNILLANNALAEVVGIIPGRLIGKKSSTINFRRAAEGSQILPWQTAIEEHRLIANTRIQFTDPNNNERTFLANCSPLLGHQGNYCGVMVTLDDVTQLEESRLQLREAKDAADAANEAKSEFLANMSHEIRTPMNAILGFTDVLRRGMEENPNQRIEYLNTIHSSGNHLIELINDILDLSKVEAGKLEIENRDFCLPSLIHETINVLSARASQKRIELSYGIAGKIPVSVVSDSTRIRQVLINLIGNAIKFTESGGVDLSCRYEKGRLKFEVNDSGIGMSSDQLERIFDPFSQADSSVTRRFGGTGLGLSISKKFVEALGGTIHAESAIGQGSTFIVEIPIEADENSLLDETGCLDLIRTKATNMVQGTNAKLNAARILVVDDADINRDIVTVVLRRHGIELLEAENGQQAIEVAAANNLDLILMDMQMPVMDGYRATSILREQGLETPIIALTGNAMQGDRQKCLDIGCDEFLPKPIEIDRLVEMLGSFIGFSSELLEVPKHDQLAAEELRHTHLIPDAAAADTNTKLESPEDLIITPWTSSLPLEDPEFLRIVEKFVNGLPERLQFMVKLLQQEDFVELREQGHWLKGVSGTVGLTRLTEPARNLEVAAENEDMERSNQLLSQIIALTASIDLSNSVNEEEFAAALQL